MTDNVISSFDGRNWRLVPRSTSQYITQTVYLTLVCHSSRISGRLRLCLSLTLVSYVDSVFESCLLNAVNVNVS